MIAHKKFQVLIFGVIILLCMVIPVSAISPTPQSVDCSLRVYLSKFFTPVPTSGYSRSYRYNSSGEKVQVTSGATPSYNHCYNHFIYMSDFDFNVVSLRIVRFENGTITRFGIGSIVYYDSQLNIIGSDIPSSVTSYYTIVHPPVGTYAFKFSYYNTAGSDSVRSNIYFVPMPTYEDSSTSTFAWDVTKSGYVEDDYIYFPVTTFQFSAFYFDLDIFPVSVMSENISFDMSIEIASVVDPTNFTPLSFSDNSSLPLFKPYSIVNGEKVYSSKVFVFEANQDYTTISIEQDLNEGFSGFEVSSYLSENSPYSSGGYFRVKFSNFVLNYDEEYELNILLDDMDRLTDEKQEQVSAVLSDLAVPTPNIDGAFSGLEELSTAYHNSEVEVVSVFHGIYNAFPIVGTFILLSISMTVLGYILFGKSG